MTLNIGDTLFNLGDYITAINGVSVNQSNVNEVLKEITSDNQVIFNMFLKSSIFREKYSHKPNRNEKLVQLWSKLTLFTPVPYFYTPWKRQKAKVFLTYSGGIEIG